jgi:hypothetical protein
VIREEVGLGGTGRAIREREVIGAPDEADQIGADVLL